MTKFQDQKCKRVEKLITEYSRRDSSIYEFPHATDCKILKVPGFDIGTWTLEDGRVVLGKRDLLRFLRQTEVAELKCRQGSVSDVEFLLPSNLLQFADSELEYLAAPIIFLDQNGTKTSGYEFQILLQIATVYLKGRRKNAVKPWQRQLCEESIELLLEWCKNRNDHVLVEVIENLGSPKGKKIEAFLEELWPEKTFPWGLALPLDFFEELFRLSDWDVKGENVPSAKEIEDAVETIVVQRLPEDFEGFKEEHQ